MIFIKRKKEPAFLQKKKAFFVCKRIKFFKYPDTKIKDPQRIEDLC